ncbi:hypothetical protein BOTBODRAFT_58499 [Botryobasidium botryosum FD-172 SS1]|uniref:NAD(P)-binding protein n=1 Tax=Botryobasidium botryosum (strain FD-172 SS1) TaxID=930990 RepID=A0A067M4T1_BOTB1|nr:hypothetical protein BOTBODRAFT_58499 [Botryobasidium botryosum FD-172 SS1]
MIPTDSTQRLVWLITGASGGFGHALTRAARARGDTVIATSRKEPAGLAETGAHTLALDVTREIDRLKEIVDSLVKQHGHIDVLVNNAGYIITCALEEATPQETLDQFNTNLFGGLNMARARSGTVVWISSVTGWRGIADAGLYVGSKYAVRGIAESMDIEPSSISPNLRSIYLEPGYFRTPFLNPSRTSRIDDYNAISRRSDQALESFNNHQPGDPERFVQVLLDYVRHEGIFAGRPKLPVGMPLGSDSFRIIGNACRKTLKVLDEWEDVIKSTDFPESHCNS